MVEEIFFFSKFLQLICSMVNILLLGGYTTYKKKLLDTVALACNLSIGETETGRLP